MAVDRIIIGRENEDIKKLLIKQMELMTLMNEKLVELLERV